MMRIPGALSLGLLMALVWAYIVPAASWEFAYEGDKLPDPAEWETFMTDGMAVSDIAEITADGSLHVIDPNDRVCFFMPPVDGVENSTIEVRVKVLSQSGAAYTIIFGIEDATVDAWIGLFPDHILIYGDGSEYSLDMTEYHVLRMTKEGDKVTIYVDGVGVMQGQVGSVADDRQDNIIFGTGSTGGTGEYFYDYVAYTGQGAFSPDELPDYLSTVAAAVDASGKLSVTWGELKAR